MSNVRLIGFVNFIAKVLSIKIVLNPFKVVDIFNMKDPIPKSLKYFVVYKFVCPGCNSCYIGKTPCHLSTRIKEHLETDKKSHIFAHLVIDETCKALSTENCFAILSFHFLLFPLVYCFLVEHSFLDVFQIKFVIIAIL